EGGVGMRGSPPRHARLSPSGEERQLGQVAAISSSTCCEGLSLAIQSVMPVQKLPAPTAPGIRSEASKRTTVDSSVSSSKLSWSIGESRLLGSSSLLADSQPGPDTLAFSLLHSGLAR